MSNELRLLLDNFQSISSGELIFKTGLNFIIGQSNSGKSATFRALKACLLNPAGSQRFIKKGHSSSHVTLLYNGNEVTWKRSAKDSSYTINGESYLKTGKSSAFKILEDQTGFVEGEDSVIMNIEEELQLPFPFGFSKSDLFKLYENVFCVSDSATILKSAKDNENDTKSRMNLLELELDKNKKKLEELDKFKKEVDLVKLSKSLKTVQEYSKKHKSLMESKAVLSELKLLNKVVIPSVIENLTDKSADLSSLRTLHKLIRQLKALHALSKSLQVKTFVNHENKYKELLELRRVVNTVSSLNKINLTPVEFNSYLERYRELLGLKETLEKAKQLNKIKIEQKHFEDNLSKYKELTTFLREIRGLQEEQKRKEDELEQAKVRLKEIQDKLKEFTVCPLCHQPLNKGDKC